MLNKSLLIGRLTAQPEVKKTPTDKSVLRVTLAVSRQFKTADGQREADFLTIVIWGNQQSCSLLMLKKGVWSQSRENYGHDGMKTRRV